MTAHNKQLTRSAAQLIELGARHLAAETTLLKRFIDLSRSIQDLLGKDLFPAPQTQSTEQDAIRAEAIEVAASRQALRAAIAQHLGIPESQATLQKLIDSLPAADAQLLVDERQKLLGLHSEITQLSNSNAILLQQSIDIYQRILHGLSGEQPRTHIYSANGQVNRETSLSMLSTQG